MVLPRSATAVQEVVRLCASEGVPFVPRGHGTGLSGGALPVEGGIVIALSRLNRVLDVDIPNRRVTVEPGVTNLEITRQVAPFGYYYAPDPSSQQVCSIGGNVAENSGGAHCLKYGFTVHHVLAADVVLPSGELVQMGSELADAPGPDLLGLLDRVGGDARRLRPAITVRILRKPEAVQTLLAAFDTIDARRRGGVGHHRRRHHSRRDRDDGLRWRLKPPKRRCIPGFPRPTPCSSSSSTALRPKCAACSIVVEQICRKNGATTIEVARTEPQRARIWKGRKAAFAAMGRVSPNYYVQDGVVPRTRLPEVLNRIRDARTHARACASATSSMPATATCTR